ncbi:MAG: hypothetical protein GX790_04005 [Syntrophomonadaceae bacterium]|nr:hypothetical protein [Syntrophomonadaceae bacterium]
MSKIIKNSSLSSQPKLIEFPLLQKMEEETNIDDSWIEEKKNKEDELNELKAESEKILKETEQMVIELLEKAQSEAKEIIINAQEEADVIRSQVYEEAKIIREQAKQSGYEEGLKIAHEEIEEDRKRALEQNELIIEEARKTKLQILRSVEPDLVRLVMAISKKVIASELKTNPESIVNIVREAITYLDNPQNVRVYVNPSELDKLLDLGEFKDLTDIGNQAIAVDVKGDNRITPGGCVIESENGIVDARIETKIQNIEKGLQEVSGDE